MSKTSHILSESSPLFAVYSKALLTLTNLNRFTLEVLNVGAVLTVAALVYGSFTGVFPKALGIAAAAVAFVFALVTALIFAAGSRDSATYDEDAVIVLGCAVRGNTVNPDMRSRLEAARAYRKKNPRALIVLSGGRCPGEASRECDIMADYLTAHGVPAESLVTEGESVSTKENFINSGALLPKGAKLCFITSDYHVFRAAKLASAAGFDGITHCHAKTVRYSVLTDSARECLALIRFFIIGRK